MSSKNNTWPGRWAADLPWWPVIQTSPTNCCHPRAPPPSPGSRPQGRGTPRHCPHPRSPARGAPPPGTPAGKRGRIQVIRAGLGEAAPSGAVGAGGCSASARQPRTPGSVPSPATAPRIYSSHLDSQLRPSKNPSACRSPCSPRCPRGRGSPPALAGIRAGRELHPKPISPSPTFPPARLNPRRDAAVKRL